MNACQVRRLAKYGGASGAVMTTSGNLVAGGGIELKPICIFNQCMPVNHAKGAQSE